MAMKKVIEATSPVQLEPMEAFKLQSLGLVQLSGNDVKLAAICRLNVFAITYLNFYYYPLEQ